MVGGDDAVERGFQDGAAANSAFAKRLMRSLEFLERARVGDCDGRLVGERPEPGEGSLIQGFAGKRCQHTQHHVARDEGMCGDTADAFAMDPLGSLEMQVVRSNVLDQDGFSRTANNPDNVSVKREAPKWAVEERPVLFLRMDGSPGARDQMKTLRAIAALVALEARIADVAGQEQPDPRQGDAGL